jgi:exonuclease I
MKKYKVKRKSEFTRLFDFYQTNKLHIQIHTNNITSLLYVSTAYSHHQQATPTHKTQ